MNASRFVRIQDTMKLSHRECVTVAQQLQRVRVQLRQGQYSWSECECSWGRAGAAAASASAAETGTVQLQRVRVQLRQGWCCWTSASAAETGPVQLKRVRVQLKQGECSQGLSAIRVPASESMHGWWTHNVDVSDRTRRGGVYTMVDQAIALNVPDALKQNCSMFQLLSQLLNVPAALIHSCSMFQLLSYTAAQCSSCSHT